MKLPNLFLQISSKKSCNLLIFSWILTNFLRKCRAQNVDSEKGHGAGKKGMALEKLERAWRGAIVKVARGKHYQKIILDNLSGHFGELSDSGSANVYF